MGWKTWFENLKSGQQIGIKSWRFRTLKPKQSSLDSTKWTPISNSFAGLPRRLAHPSQLWRQPHMLSFGWERIPMVMIVYVFHHGKFLQRCSGPARLAQTGQLLGDLVSSSPELLGEESRAKFGDKLPFLFKVPSWWGYWPGGDNYQEFLPVFANQLGDQS